ncbi:MAG TPA: ABC transporter permease [Acidimicrobiales bacterium]|jgi:peptide/nickel transport system permease protein|nr:ABC transporter permease [Acidimicrobiales bacterium]
MTLTPGDVASVPAEEEPGVGDEPEGEAARVIEGRSPWRLAYERLRHDRASMIALAIIVVIILMAIFAPVFATLTGHGVYQQFRTTGLSPAGLPVHPSGQFLFGTDDQGRDILVRVAYGARISLIVGVVATLLEVAIGTVLGLAAGYFGKVVDTVIARIIDIVLSIPFLLFAISLVSISHPSLTIVIVVIGVFGWAAVARVVRGQVLSLREKEYIEAARSLGAGSWRIMFVDILPNIVAPIIVYASLLIPVTIVIEASLSYLGIGVPPPTADWGTMISGAQQLYQQAWWYLFFPSAALLVTTVAFNIFGDGLRDALDPRSNQLFT